MQLWCIFGISITRLNHEWIFSDRTDRLFSFCLSHCLHILKNLVSTMAAIEAATAQPGDIEFCTLGMFILGMLISIFETPRCAFSQCSLAQMTLTSAALDGA